MPGGGGTARNSWWECAARFPKILTKKCHFPHPFLDLASKICFHLQTRPQVVQTLDSAILRINHYPVDKYLGNQWRYTLNNFYPVECAIRRLNNRGLAFKKLCHHYLDYEQQQKRFLKIHFEFAYFSYI